MNAMEKSRRFDEIVGQPVMTAQQRIEQMKRDREVLRQPQAVSPQLQNAVSVDSETVQQDSSPDSRKKAVSSSGKKQRTGVLTYEMLQDCFRPKEITTARVQRTIHTRKDVVVMENRLLKILGGMGAKHFVGKEKFSVSLSAFYSHLVFSFFQTHKDEIEAIERQLEQQN